VSKTLDDNFPLFISESSERKFRTPLAAADGIKGAHIIKYFSTAYNMCTLYSLTGGMNEDENISRVAYECLHFVSKKLMREC
jgi:hypothetical protein